MGVAGPGFAARALGLLRLVHPFPSLLDGLLTAAIAIVAGGSPAVVLALGLAMTLLQFTIGTVNDLADAGSDAATRPDKPIPAGLVGRDAALVLAAGLLASGLAISALLGPAVLALALAGVAAGLAYDLALKGTAWAWAPFAVGIALLPAYAWVGATGSLPGPLAVLMALAAVEGAALAFANALVDVDGDAAIPRRTPAVRLGPRRTWWLTAALQAVAVGLAAGSMIVLGIPGSGIQGPIQGVSRLAALGLALVGSGTAVMVVGLALSRSLGRRRRRLGWELQGIGAATVAVGWVLVVLVGPSGVGEAG